MLNRCFLVLLVGLVGCAGYHFKYRTNPFDSYGVASVAIPTFVNYSALADVSAPMTKEISLLLRKYSGLRVYAGDNDNADAVLLGIIDSSELISETSSTTATEFTSGGLQDSVGQRRPFYLPSQTSYKLKLRVVLIKRPTAQELELLTSELGRQVKKGVKVVFNETLELHGSFTRSLKPNLQPDDGGVVNFTHNKGIMDENLNELAKSAANNFKEVVLDAF